MTSTLTKGKIQNVLYTVAKLNDVLSKPPMQEQIIRLAALMIVFDDHAGKPINDPLEARAFELSLNAKIERIERKFQR